MEQPHIRKWYERTGYPIEVFGESLTHQEFVKESNINSIMAKYKKTGQLPMVQGRPMFGDFASLPEYQDALNLVLDAETAFADLPSEIRTRFGNDPAEFVEFCSNPDNLDEAVELGLAKAPKPDITDEGGPPPVYPDENKSPPAEGGEGGGGD